MHHTIYHASNDANDDKTTLMELMRALGKNIEGYMPFMVELYGEDFVKTLKALQQADVQFLSALSSSSLPVDELKKAVTGCEDALVEAVKDAMKKTVVKG